MLQPPTHVVASAAHQARDFLHELVGVFDVFERAFGRDGLLPHVKILMKRDSLPHEKILTKYLRAMTP